MNELIFQEGHWVWENSSVPFNYTYWNPGEPNNAGGNEDCLAFWFSTRKWNDVPCDYASAYKPLCQITASAGSSTVTATTPAITTSLGDAIQVHVISFVGGFTFDRSEK